MLCTKMIKLILYAFFRFFSDSKKALTVFALIVCNLLLMSYYVQQESSSDSGEIVNNHFMQENTSVLYTVSDAYEFDDNISWVINKAQHNRTLSSGIYLQYHTAVTKTYTNLKNTVDVSSHVFSDSNFFTYTFDVVFYIACTLIFSFTIYSEDYILGLPTLTRSTKLGQKHLSFCKLCSVILFSLSIICITTYTEWILFGQDLNLVSPVQTLPYMAICPYPLLIYEYIFISSFCKFLVCILYVFVCLLLICKSQNIVWSGFYSACIAILFIVVSELPINSSFSVLNYISPQSMSDANSLFSHYSVIACFDNIVPAIPVVFGFYILSIVILSIFVCQRTASYIQGTRLTSPIIAKKISFRTLPQKKRSSYSLHILTHEFYKCFISQKLYIIILVAIFASIGSQLQTPRISIKNASELYYHEFISDYSGNDVNTSLWSPIKSENINATASILDVKKNRWNTASSDFMSGKISITEYENILAECSDAVTKREVFRNIERYNSYLASCGEPVCFVYDTGWKFLFERSLDIPIYIATLLIASSIFTIETDSKVSASGMDTIVRTTLFGRKKTYFSKVTVSCFCICLLYFCSEFYVISYLSNTYSLPLPEASIQSLMLFKDSTLDITIGQALLLYELVRFVQLLLFSFLFSSFSHLIKNSFISIICGVIFLSISSLFVCDMSIFISVIYLIAIILFACLSFFWSWISCSKWGLN